MKCVSSVADEMTDDKTHSIVPVKLDKSRLAQDLQLKALRVQAKQCQSLMKKFAG